MGLFGSIELVALANLAVLYGFIALCRIVAEGQRPGAPRK